MSAAINVSNAESKSKSNKCLNPDPVYTRPKTWNKLSGELGKGFNYLRKRDVSLDPYFVKLRHIAKRKRHFNWLVRPLMNAFVQAAWSHIDYATDILMLDYAGIARVISQQKTFDDNGDECEAVPADVLVCRISRLVNKILIPYGLCGVQGGLVYDKTHKMYFPKVLVFNPAFYALAGADMENINLQRERYAAARIAGLTELGENPTRDELRKKKRAEVFKKSWEARRERAGKTKTKEARKAKLADMPIDQRLHAEAKRLMMELEPEVLAALSAEQFKQLAWKELNLQGLGVKYQAPDKTH